MLDLERPRPLLPVGGEQTSLVYVPLGVGAIVSPWNFPLSLTTGMMSAALVAGNTVVVKPASASATSATWLVDLFRECGTPAGVINLLTGSGGLIGDALVDHPQTRFVAFTGSKDVGVRINERAARLQPGQIWIKRVQLELGGKNATLVDETADLERAAEAIVTSAFGYQGQKCSACSRAIVVDSVHDELRSRIIERARRLRLGDPAERDTDLGPLVDESAFRKVVEYVDIGRAESTLVFGGGTREGGYYVEPTIFDDVSPRVRIAQEEIFGPVLAIIRARDFDHALDIANDTQFGLAGAVFTTDPDRIEQARQRFHVGNLYINRKCTGALTGAHPFGGFNLSGTDSKAGGPDYLLFFLQAKSVAVRAD
jgi:1-pyrroline-5-carboxylate dehydrogenase